MTSSNWTRENLAWLAGLVEGEGSLTLERKSRNTLRIKIKMTDEDVIRRAHAVAGVGSVYGPYKVPRASGGFHKDQWVWVSQRNAESYAIMAALAPWFLSRRRAQLVSIVTSWNGFVDPHCLGSRNPQASLTPEEVAIIRQQYNGKRWGTGERAELAQRFNCSPQVIGNVSSGRTYRDLL